MNTSFHPYPGDDSSGGGKVKFRGTGEVPRSARICRNYLLAVLGVALSSSLISDIYHNPATVAQQDKITGFAPYAVVALISRNCPVCLVPNGEAQRR